jgi:hypothetical protein
VIIEGYVTPNACNNFHSGLDRITKVLFTTTSRDPVQKVDIERYIIPLVELDQPKSDQEAAKDAGIPV